MRVGESVVLGTRVKERLKSWSRVAELHACDYFPGTARAWSLLRAGVPLSLLCDLADPDGPPSREIYTAEAVADDVDRSAMLKAEPTQAGDRSCCRRFRSTPHERFPGPRRHRGPCRSRMCRIARRCHSGRRLPGDGKRRAERGAPGRRMPRVPCQQLVERRHQRAPQAPQERRLDAAHVTQVEAAP